MVLLDIFIIQLPINFKKFEIAETTQKLQLMKEKVVFLQGQHFSF